MSTMTNVQKWLVGLFCLGLLAGMVVISVCFRNDYGFTSMSVRTVILVISIFCIALAVLALHRGAMNNRLILSRRIIYYPQMGDSKSSRVTIRAVDPMLESKFWDHSTISYENPNDDICSICLCSVEGERYGRKSACCNSSFHTYCVLQYWQSIGGEVLCPNCRHEFNQTT